MWYWAGFASNYPLVAILVYSTVLFHRAQNFFWRWNYSMLVPTAWTLSRTRSFCWRRREEMMLALKALTQSDRPLWRSIPMDPPPLGATVREFWILQPRKRFSFRRCVFHLASVGALKLYRSTYEFDWSCYARSLSLRIGYSFSSRTWADLSCFPRQVGFSV